MKTELFTRILAAATCLSVIFSVACSDDDDQSGGGENPPSTAIELNESLGGLYFGDFWDEGYGDYYFLLTNDQTGQNNNGEMVPMHPGGYILYCDLWGALSENSRKAVLPEGTYSASEKRAPDSFTLELTLCTVNREQVGDQFRVEDVHFSDGTITVKHIADGYDIHASFVTTEGEPLEFVYRGPIVFEDQSDDQKPQWEIGRNVEIKPCKVTKALMPDEGCDKYVLRCFDVDQISEDGLHPNCAGNKLEVNIYVDKGKDIDGVYRVGSHQVGSFEPGVRIGKFAGGSHCENVDAKMQIHYSLLSGGELRIEKNTDGSYSFHADFETKDGYTVKGEWKSVVEEFKPFVAPQSTLKSDVEFVALQCSEIRFFGDYYKNGTANYSVVLANEEELLVLDLCAAEGTADALPVGRFAVSEDHQGGTMNRGSVDSQGAVPTCYVKYDLKTGNAVEVAPVYSGTLEITRADDVYTFVIDLYDDFNRNDESVTAHKISGRWSGTLPKIKMGNEQ